MLQEYMIENDMLRWANHYLRY